jgi:hypothetical protein
MLEEKMILEEEEIQRVPTKLDSCDPTFSFLNGILNTGLKVKFLFFRSRTLFFAVLASFFFFDEKNQELLLKKKVFGFHDTKLHLCLFRGMKKKKKNFLCHVHGDLALRRRVLTNIGNAKARQNTFNCPKLSSSFDF